jgi:hypothetical protein
VVAIPRILRAVPRGAITRSEQGIPVMAVIHWNDGWIARVPALARAWTSAAVEVMWETPDGDFRTDWLPARDVARPDSRGAPTGPDAPDVEPLEAGMPRRAGAPAHAARPPRSHPADRRRGY